VVATYIQFARDWQLIGRENCMCGRQYHAKFTCLGGYYTTKPPVFCNDAGNTNM